MAVITKDRDTLFRVKCFRGLNECPSGDAGLEPGEGAEMKNFRITQEGSLQVRPGTRTLWRFPGPVEGIWSGNVGGRKVKVAAAGGELWLLGEPGEAEPLGKIGEGRCSFFPFDRKLNLLTPKRYLVWTGYGQVTDVPGYRPVVATGVPPAGGGSLLEEVNKLTGARRAFFSPDGTAVTFRLPETGVTRVDYVIARKDGTHLPYTADEAAGTVTLTSPPPQGTDTVEIGWTKGAGDRAHVVGMNFAELFSGLTDNRVLLYGDGTNRILYSGVNYDGDPDPTYFPDLNVIEAGSANTPVTGIIRHFSRLIVFKPDGAFSVQAGSAQTAQGKVIPTFHVLPIQREMGCDGMGQVTLVDNDPVTLWGGGVYRWKSGSGYLTLDERIARRISGRVEESLRGFDLTKARVFDDQSRREWYLCCGETALVHNYGRDVWYRYEDFPARCMGTLEGALYLGTADGRLMAVSRAYRNDDGAPIDALWRSGSISFDRPWARKFIKRLWLSLKPESGAAIRVSTRSDRESRMPEEVVRASLMSYGNAGYHRWSYSTNRQPRVARVELHLKKAAYGQLLLTSHSAGETATVLGLEGKVRYGRDAK